MKFIGGDIEYLGPTINKNKYLNQLDNYLFFSTGRTALHYILKNYSNIKKVLLPSYLCTSILQPIEELNLEYDFFSINSNLDTDEEQLLKKLKDSKADVLLFINYFGFTDQTDVIKKIKKLLPEVLIIEDNTHLTFIPEVLDKYKPVGDVVFGSLRKMLGIADGAYVRKNNHLKENTLNSIIPDFYVYRYMSKLLRKEYLKLNKRLPEIEKSYLDLLKRSEDEIYKHTPQSKMSTDTEELIKQMDYEKIYHQRKLNYEAIDKELRSSNTQQMFQFFNKNSETNPAPYMYPVKLPGKRDFLRKELLRYNIFTPVIWEISEEYRNVKEFKDAMKISDSIICLPIDQRYDRSDMRGVVKAIEEILK